MLRKRQKISPTNCLLEVCYEYQQEQPSSLFQGENVVTSSSSFPSSSQNIFTKDDYVTMFNDYKRLCNNPKLKNYLLPLPFTVDNQVENKVQLYFTVDCDSFFKNNLDVLENINNKLEKTIKNQIPQEESTKKEINEQLQTFNYKMNNMNIQFNYILEENTNKITIEILLPYNGKYYKFNKVPKYIVKLFPCSIGQFEIKDFDTNRTLKEYVEETCQKGQVKIQSNLWGLSNTMAIGKIDEIKKDLYLTQQQLNNRS